MHLHGSSGDRSPRVRSSILTDASCGLLPLRSVDCARVEYGVIDHFESLAFNLAVEARAVTRVACRISDLVNAEQNRIAVAVDVG